MSNFQKYFLSVFHNNLFSPYSLYPFLAKSVNVPLGNPKYLVSREQIQSVLKHKNDGFYYLHEEGPIKVVGICYAFCAVPRDNGLKNLPFLPLSHKGKTYRVECHFCLVNEQKSLCKCDLKQRGFYGTYHLEEISYAISLNYHIEIKEALIYFKAKPIFRDFFKLLAHMKLRHETSEPLMTEQRKAEYCHDLNYHMQFEGRLQLTPDILEPNFALRQFCKSVSNIVCGKFGQYSRKSIETYIHNDDDLSDLFYDPTIDIKNAFILSDDTVAVTYTPKKEGKKVNRLANCIIAGLITSQGKYF